MIEQRERETMHAIRRALQKGALKQPFRGSDIDAALGIYWRGIFLAKHCEGTGSSTARFIRLSRGLYQLRDSGDPTLSRTV